MQEAYFLYFSYAFYDFHDVGKAMFKNIWDQIVDNYPGKASDLAEELGIELA